MIPRDRLEALWSQGVRDARTLAHEFRVHPDSVRRAVRRAGLRTRLPRSRVVWTEYRELRMRALMAEQMPLTWIAEDLGVPARALQRRLRPGMPAEWPSVWQSIRQNEEMLALHREFAPRKGNG